MKKLTNFTELKQDKLETILQWRNHPKIKNNMYAKHEISLQEHLNFVKRLQNNPQDIYFLVSHENKDIGVIYFNQITDTSCKMGLYANPNTKGIGKILLDEIKNYGFNTLTCKTIKAEVYIYNLKALELYKSFGFTKKQQNKDVIFMELYNETK